MSPMISRFFLLYTPILRIVYSAFELHLVHLIGTAILYMYRESYIRYTDLGNERLSVLLKLCQTQETNGLLSANGYWSKNNNSLMKQESFNYNEDRRFNKYLYIYYVCEIFETFGRVSSIRNRIYRCVSLKEEETLSEVLKMSILLFF